MQKKLLNSFLATVMTMVLTIAGILGGVSFYVGEEVACADAATTVTGLSAQQIAQNMGVGWNLGNSLDVPGSETDWGNPATTQAMLQAVKDKGFGAVRIPITWYPYLSSDGNYTVDSTRMARVKEVVDYAYDLGLYVIINVHHENWININNSTGTISASEYAAMSTELKAVWTQIGTEFAGYDQRLVFEGMNEPHLYENSIEIWWNTDADTLEYINMLDADFVDTIRDLNSGYNDERLLMVTQYAASSSSDIFSHIDYDLFEDDMVAMSIHGYLPYDFAMNNSGSHTWSSDYAGQLGTNFSSFAAYFSNKGIQVILGEFSASDFDNLSDRTSWAQTYMTYAKQYGIPCFLWDNNATGYSSSKSSNSENHGYLNRSSCTWYSYGEDVVDALIETRNSGNIEWGSSVEVSQHIDTQYGLSMYSGSAVVGDTSIPTSGYCEGTEIAVKYSGTMPTTLAFMDASWGNWTTVSASDFDDSNNIVYFKYDVFDNAWTASSEAMCFIIQGASSATTITGVYLLPCASRAGLVSFSGDSLTLDSCIGLDVLVGYKNITIYETEQLEANGYGFSYKTDSEDEMIVCASADSIALDPNSKIVIKNTTTGEVLYSKNRADWDAYSEGEDINGFTYSIRVGADEIRDEVSVVLTMSNNVSVNIGTYSVEDYISETMSYEDTDSTLYNLVYAVLLYGNGFEDFKDGTLNLTATDKAWLDSLTSNPDLSEYRRSSSGSVSGLTYYGSSLLVDSMTVVRHYFTLQSGYSISDYTFTYGSNTYTPVLKDGYYYVELDGVCSNELNIMTTTTVSHGSENLSISYCPYSYVYGQLNSNSASDELKYVVKAIYAYGSYAKEYFSNNRGEL